MWKMDLLFPASPEIDSRAPFTEVSLKALAVTAMACLRTLTCSFPTFFMMLRGTEESGFYA